MAEATAQRAVLEVQLSYAYEPPAEPVPFVSDIACVRTDVWRLDMPAGEYIVAQSQPLGEALRRP